MEILYNGNIYKLDTPCTLSEFLNKTGKEKMPYTLKLNGNFIPKQELETTFLKEGDELNIILFMGGG